MAHASRWLRTADPSEDYAGVESPPAIRPSRIGERIALAGHAFPGLRPLLERNRDRVADEHKEPADRGVMRGLLRRGAALGQIGLEFFRVAIAGDRGVVRAAAHEREPERERERQSPPRGPVIHDGGAHARRFPARMKRLGMRSFHMRLSASWSGLRCILRTMRLRGRQDAAAMAARPYLCPERAETASMAFGEDPSDLKARAPFVGSAAHLRIWKRRASISSAKSPDKHDTPVLLYSIGKDFAVLLHLARKAFYPGRLPFPLLHIDTTLEIPGHDRLPRRDGAAARSRFARLHQPGRRPARTSIRSITTASLTTRS